MDILPLGKVEHSSKCVQAKDGEVGIGQPLKNRDYLENRIDIWFAYEHDKGAFQIKDVKKQAKHVDSNQPVGRELMIDYGRIMFK